ncbi:MAG: methylmalonyl Co-A mutase-associated GTPase MeaB [Syntrophobacteraceae bacterium]|nr:methylmalonyl Co-A mutase-associated GTPase MeaB [Syntrophobacteraceae bacterium]
MDIIQQIVSGDVRTIARVLRDIDDELPSSRSVLQRLHPHTGKAHVIGFTGSPGVGKSSLVDQIATAYRKESKTVGILAVDPTSPFTGGAILGDRIRMQRHFLDPGVFIRSLATRGQFGGLSKSTNDMVNVLDAAGKDVVLVETVGVGQDEVEIANSAHTTVLVMVPGMGDDIQAIKAGVMEIGNIFVVNKADREGSRKTVRELMNLVEIGARRRNDENWEPQIVETEAVKGRGIDKLCETIESHKAYLQAAGSEKWREASQKRIRLQLLGALRDEAFRAILARIEKSGDSIDEIVRRIVARESDPYTVVQQIVDGLR